MKHEFIVTIITQEAQRMVLKGQSVDETEQYFKRLIEKALEPMKRHEAMFLRGSGGVSEED